MQLGERLKRMHRRLNETLYLDNKFIENDTSVREVRENTKILNSLFRADYNAKDTSQIMLEHPFTYLGLAMYEKCSESIEAKEANLQ
jgi:hypothetical protein